MSKYTWINMGSSNGFLYDRTELLLKAIMTCHQVDPLTTVSMEDVTPLLTSWNCAFHELGHQYDNFTRDASAISAKLAWKFILWGLIICLITIIEVDGWRCLVVILMLQRPLLVTQTRACADGNVYKWKVSVSVHSGYELFYLVRTDLFIWTKTIS